MDVPPNCSSMKRQPCQAPARSRASAVPISAARGDDQPEREVRRGLDQSLAGGEHRDPALARGELIDAVGAGTRDGDDPQARACAPGPPGRRPASDRRSGRRRARRTLEAPRSAHGPMAPKDFDLVVTARATRVANACGSLVLAANSRGVTRVAR